MVLSSKYVNNVSMLFLSCLCLLQQSRDGKLSMKEQGIIVSMAWDARLDLPVKVSLVHFLPFLCHAISDKEREGPSLPSLNDRRERVCTKSNLVSKFYPIQISVIERFGFEFRK